MNKKQETNAFIKECITMALLKMMEEQPFERITITELTKKPESAECRFTAILKTRRMS